EETIDRATASIGGRAAMPARCSETARGQVRRLNVARRLIANPRGVTSVHGGIEISDARSQPSPSAVSPAALRTTIASALTTFTTVHTRQTIASQRRRAMRV